MDLALTASLCAVLVFTWAVSAMLFGEGGPAPVSYRNDVITVQVLSDTNFHFHMTQVTYLDCGHVCCISL